MLFCSGIGGGILYWSGVEWAYYVNQPPFGLEPLSQDSYMLASAYGAFHWGISGWALYCLPTVVIAVPFYHYKLGSLRLSSGLRGLRGNQVENSILGRCIDLIFVIVAIGASGGSMGMYIPVISAGISELYGVEHNLTLDLSVLLFCTLLFALSVFLGLKKGIRMLSNINVVTALVFLLFILLLGPFKEIIALSGDAIKQLIQKFGEMSTLGIGEKSEFAETWTIFYWAWWLALGPQVGLFVTRVSKGRSLRQLITGMIFFGSLGCFLFYMILGNYAINLELSGQLAVSELLVNEGHRITATKVLLTLPFGSLFLFAYCLMVVIFIATSYDSVSYVIAYHVKRTSSEMNEPDRKMRLFWAFILAILPAALFIIDLNRVAMDVILLMSLPLLFICPVLALSLVRTLKNHYSESNQ
jgi:BCCT family betaine/carnitine transporter